jgi:outer membrane protein assembly factor BamE
MKYLYLTALALSVGGCSMPQIKVPDLKIPRVYKLSVQQGNVITQEMVDRLEPGMTRNQVEYVMGRPVLQDPFDDDQWVYLYSLEVPDVFIQAFKMVLTFEEDTLVTITGDYLPTTAEEKAQQEAQEEVREEMQEATQQDVEETEAEDVADAVS